MTDKGVAGRRDGRGDVKRLLHHDLRTSSIKKKVAVWTVLLPFIARCEAYMDPVCYCEASSVPVGFDLGSHRTEKEALLFIYLFFWFCNMSDM